MYPHLTSDKKTFTLKPNFLDKSSFFANTLSSNGATESNPKLPLKH